MNSRKWKVAEAKAQFSQLVRQAQGAPQFIENHGTPTGVMMSVGAFQKLSAHVEAAENGVLRFLQRAEEARRQGGVTLRISRRDRKNSLKESEL